MGAGIEHRVRKMGCCGFEGFFQGFFGQVIVIKANMT